MDEFSLIQAIRPCYYKQTSLIKGIGDDAAVFRQTTQDIVTAIDVFVEGVHFTRQTMDPFHIGYRALAANLSDLAAMGAEPKFYLVAIVIPKTWSDTEIMEIYTGMKALEDKYTLDLIGGDTVSGSKLTISITVIGYTDKNHARYRDAARDGDIVFVTGTVGDSQAGLYMLTYPGKYIDRDYFIKRHRMPTPRHDFVQKLTTVSRMALNDISDGMANEAIEIAEASQVTIHIEENQVPTYDTIAQFPKQLTYRWKLFGGEDFELLGTVSPEEWPFVEAAATSVNLKVTKIGSVSYDKDELGTVFLQRGNEKIKLAKDGYTHLK